MMFVVPMSSKMSATCQAIHEWCECHQRCRRPVRPHMAPPPASSTAVFAVARARGQSHRYQDRRLAQGQGRRSEEAGGRSCLESHRRAKGLGARARLSEGKSNGRNETLRELQASRNDQDGQQGVGGRHLFTRRWKKMSRMLRKKRILDGEYRIEMLFAQCRKTRLAPTAYADRDRCERIRVVPPSNR